MRRIALSLLLFAVGCSREPDVAFTDVSITLPDDTTALPPGPHVELATQNCTACHSADMILNQPRLTRKAWEANVEKMVKVYKANIDPKDAPQIVDYLVATNARLAK
jgi:sulfite dehydrogenase (cytochrome) subunit B